MILLFGFRLHSLAQTDPEFVLAFSQYVEVPYIDDISEEQQIGNAIRLFVTGSIDNEPRLLRDINTPFFSETNPIWSNNGTSVLYGFSYQLGNFLHIYDIESDGLVTVSAPIDFQTLAWSPSNRYVALSNGIASNDQTIFGEWSIVDLNHEEILRIERGQVAQWMQDQDILLINERDTAQITTPQSRLVSYDVTNNTQTIILESTDLILSPTWSSNGQYIFYSVLEGDNTNIYRLEMGSGNIEQFTDDDNYRHIPIASPNAHHIAYINRYPNGIMSSLHLIEANGENDRQVLPFGNYFDFQWLPNGNGFVFYVQVEEDLFGNHIYSLAWLDLVCMDTETGCTSDNIEIIPNTETIQRYPFDIWMP